MSSDQLTLFAVDSPVKTYQWPAAARAWLESGRDCGMSSIALLTALNRDGLLSKTSPAFYPATEDKTLPPSFAGWLSAGMASPGGFWTLNISEFPSAAVASSLSGVLEPLVHQKYFLSARALTGIRRRLTEKGIAITQAMENAIRLVLGGTEQT